VCLLNVSAADSAGALTQARGVGGVPESALRKHSRPALHDLNVFYALGGMQTEN
jgi:hypothetical protein